MHRTKVGQEYSSCRDINYGVPQGSVLGPLLFNLFLNDIFYFMEKAKIANFVDDNSPYTVEENVMTLLKSLQSETSVVLNWFEINEMKANSSKCHLIVCDLQRKHYSSKSYVYLNLDLIESEETVKLLGLTIDNKLTFEEHITKLLKKGNQKLHALFRIKCFLSKEKLRIIMKTFIESQFNYCPLHSRRKYHQFDPKKGVKSRCLSRSVTPTHFYYPGRILLKLLIA